MSDARGEADPHCVRAFVLMEEALEELDKARCSHAAVLLDSAICAIPSHLLGSAIRRYQPSEFMPQQAATQASATRDK